MRRAAIAAAGLALLAPAPAQADICPGPPDPAVPTWTAVNRFELGSRAATNEEIGAYLAAVDAASDRVVTGVAGSTVQGRPLPYAFVSEAAQVQRLDAIAAHLRAVRRAAARASGPAIAWIAASVHSQEPAGADADMRLLYDLAAHPGCPVTQRLVVGLLPVQNPDGRAAGTRGNANGFDLNRDWFARTQPETEAKLRLLQRYPPIAFVDQHEERGRGFFFPPYVDPIHHEVSSQALNAVANVVAPAISRAFDARGFDYVTRSTYDLFFMGYGDSATTTLFGAAGMTFEKGTDAPYPEKVEQLTVADGATLEALAQHRDALLRAWGEQWVRAKAEGTRGELQPNTATQDETTVLFRVPSRPVRAYAIRADVAGADAAALMDRLRTVGVVVRRLRHAVRVRSFRPYGRPGARAARLPAGTWIVPLAQAQKHWVEAQLGADPYVPFPYFYDVSSWSNPLLMGLEGGAIGSRLPRGALSAARPRARAGTAFAGDSEAAAEAAFELLRSGVALQRVPVSGEFVAPAGADLAGVLGAHGVGALATAPPGSVALRLPKVAMLAGLQQTTDPGSAPSGSSAWSRHLLARRYGLAVDELSDADLAAGRLQVGGYHAFVVPDGVLVAGALSAPALTQLQAWVRAGGTFVGWRAQGIAVARGAGLTTATTRATTIQTPGALLRVDLDPADAVGWGERRQGFAFNGGDPILEGGGHAAVRYPGRSGFFVSGYATGTEALYGTAAVVHEPVGSGRVVLFAFDPAFRGYTDGTERLVANALLAPAPAAKRAAPRAVRRIVPLVNYLSGPLRQE